LGKGGEKGECGGVEGAKGWKSRGKAEGKRGDREEGGVGGGGGRGTHCLERLGSYLSEKGRQEKDVLSGGKEEYWDRSRGLSKQLREKESGKES